MFFVFTVLTADRRSTVLVFPVIMSMMTTNAFNSREKMIEELKAQIRLGFNLKKKHLNDCDVC